MRYPVFGAAAIFLILLSCENEIPYDISGGEDLLIMNAQMRTDDSLHVVRLAISRPYSIEPLPDTAVVSCYVNGSLAAVADTVWMDREVQHQGFCADFAPGDSVTVEVSCPPFHARAMVCVAEPALIAGLDTLSSIGNAPPFRFYDRMNLIVQDRPGERNYYRAFAVEEGRAELRCGADGPALATWVREDLSKVDTDDPVFRSIPIELPEDLSDQIGMNTSRTNVPMLFTDYLFQDGTYAVRYRGLSETRFIWHGHEVREPYDHLAIYVTFRIGSMPRAEYFYLNAVDAAGSIGLNPFAEPVVLMDNVEGGIGFVGIQTVTKFEVLMDNLPVTWRDT